MTNELKYGEELPVIKAKVRVYNPSYDRTDSESKFMIDQVVEVQVLTLNLNSGTMRVRFNDFYDGKHKVVTQDISNLAFFQQYSIVKA